MEVGVVEIADLLEEGLKSKTVPPPFELRNVIWEINEVLLRDDEPSQVSEGKYDGENGDLISLSLNTVRGKAMHLVFFYGLWCAKHQDLSRNESRMVSEVREQLERTLRLGTESTRMERTLYGLYLPSLFYMDENWIEKHLHDIFPKDEEHRAFWRAAWEAYVTYNHPYDDIYKKLRDHYRIAVDKTDSIKISKDAKSRISEHLITVYVRGLEELENDSVIKLLFERAQTEVRRHALWFAGKILRDIQESNIDGKTRERFIKRIMNLWEWRVGEAKKVSGRARENFVQELKEFGMWFTKDSLDKNWAISQLVTTLELTNGELEFSSNVIENLSDYAKERHLEVLRVLIQLVKGDKKGLLLILSKEKITELMDTIAKDHPPHEIKGLMNELVDELVKKRSFDSAKFLIK